jgi:hypothetical protein
MKSEANASETGPNPQVLEAIATLTKGMAYAFRNLETSMNGSSRSAFTGYLKAVASGEEPFSLDSLIRNYSSGNTSPVMSVNNFAVDKKVVPDELTLATINRFIYQAYVNICQAVPQAESRMILLNYLGDIVGGSGTFNQIAGNEYNRPIEFVKLEEQ